MKQTGKKFLRLLIGLAVMSFGSAMALVADLGMEPWDVLNDGMARFLQSHIGITLSNVQNDLQTYPYLIVSASIIMALIMICFNLFGNGLRDAFNPALKGADD